LQGLWGPGSAFADFEAFLASMKKRGVSFLEMLSMEMKVTQAACIITIELCACFAACAALCVAGYAFSM